jgi:hypothetical protein
MKRRICLSIFMGKHEGIPDPTLHVFRVAPFAQRPDVGRGEPGDLWQVQQPVRARPQLHGGGDGKRTGMVCNLVDLDGCVHEKILERYDHQNLNLLPEFGAEVPTTENLCISIYEILNRSFTKAHLEKIRIEETMMNSFEYSGPGTAGKL